MVTRAAAAVVLLLLVACGGDKKPKTPVCHGNKDCAAGTVCSDNKCVECAADTDCPKDKPRCSANACVAKAECEKDADCKPDGKVCQAGVCKGCVSDAECGPGGSCTSGLCRKGKTCQKDDQCADDEDCVQGFCLKGGGRNTGTGDASCALQTIYFGFDQAGIEASERDRLDQNAACIEKNKAKSVFVVGHTDTSGTEEYNIALSERRAQTVADYLARLGTDPARLQVVPKGETEPTGAGDDKDRRVEFQWH